jgi:hypothetical protein
LHPDGTCAADGVKSIFTFKEKMMIKQLLLGATLATAALATTPLLADPGHRHGQNTACSGQNCPAATAQGGHGHHGGHARMAQGQREHGGHGKHGRHGMHGGQGAQHGHGADGCPMHGERKPT